MSPPSGGYGSTYVDSKGKKVTTLCRAATGESGRVAARTGPNTSIALQQGQEGFFRALQHGFGFGREHQADHVGVAVRIAVGRHGDALVGLRREARRDEFVLLEGRAVGAGDVAEAGDRDVGYLAPQALLVLRHGAREVFALEIMARRRIDDRRRGIEAFAERD